MRTWKQEMRTLKKQFKDENFQHSISTIENQQNVLLSTLAYIYFDIV